MPGPQSWTYFVSMFLNWLVHLMDVDKILLNSGILKKVFNCKGVIYTL